MKEIEIPLPRGVERLPIRKIIADTCVSCGLRVTLETTLRKFPESTHWHFKKGDETGTLEITFWPAQCRAWFSIQGGRSAPWLEDKITLLQDLFQRAFRSKHAPNKSLERTRASARFAQFRRSS